MKKIKNMDKRAAIVCQHIAYEKYPILRAILDEPLEPADSGWQFLCNTGKFEDENKAQVWSISEVLAYEPTLVGILNESIGAVLFREQQNKPWQKEKK